MTPAHQPHDGAGHTSPAPSARLGTVRTSDAATGAGLVGRRLGDADAVPRPSDGHQPDQPDGRATSPTSPAPAAPGPSDQPGARRTVRATMPRDGATSRATGRPAPGPCVPTGAPVRRRYGAPRDAAPDQPDQPGTDAPGTSPTSPAPTAPGAAGDQPGARAGSAGSTSPARRRTSPTSPATDGAARPSDQPGTSRATDAARRPSDAPRGARSVGRGTSPARRRTSPAPGASDADGAGRPSWNVPPDKSRRQETRDSVGRRPRHGAGRRMPAARYNRQDERFQRRTDRRSDNRKMVRIMSDVIFPDKTVELARIPDCDLCGPCRMKSPAAPAMCDSPVSVLGRTTWAYTCPTCYTLFATDNASALGTRLVLAGTKSPA